MIRTTKDNLNIIDHCAAKNPQQYNTNKALEEAIEFQEVLIKLQTKNVKNPRRPKQEEALKEYGDVIFRGFIALKNVFPNLTSLELMGEVSKHIDYKLSKLTTYRKEGNYEGGL